MKSKMTHVVWWWETDSFNGKVARHYRDFTNLKNAVDFAQQKLAEHFVPRLHISEIKQEPWHHFHATISKANAGKAD